jgi:hypothetical protein
MRFTTLQGEKSIAALVTRVYGDLPEDRRATARDALIRANPQLEKFREVQPGSVLVIPPLTKGKASGRADEIQPSAAVVREVIDALGAFRTELTEAAEAEDRDVSRTVAMFKSEEVQALARVIPEVQEEIRRVGQAAKERGENADAARELAKRGLEEIAQDLDALAKSLR